MKTYLPILFVILFTGSCHSPKYLSKPMEFKYHVKGLILDAKLNEGTKILGEILEVNSESIIVISINETPSHITTIMKDGIRRADIIISTTSDKPEKISRGAALANLATLGHGWGMILSVPINLVMTIAISNNAAHASYRVSYPKDLSWEQMSKFARFPQGIPNHIDLNQIH